MRRSLAPAQDPAQWLLNFPPRSLALLLLSHLPDEISQGLDPVTLSLGLGVKYPLPPLRSWVFPDTPPSSPLMSPRSLPSQLEDMPMAPTAHWGPPQPQHCGDMVMGHPRSHHPLAGGAHLAGEVPGCLQSQRAPQFSLLSPGVSLPQSEQHPGVLLLLSCGEKGPFPGCVPRG